MLCIVLDIDGGSISAAGKIYLDRNERELVLENVVQSKHGTLQLCGLSFGVMKMGASVRLT